MARGNLFEEHMLPIIGSIIGIVSSVIDRVIPDKAAADKVKLEIMQLEAKGELDIMLKQLEINANEANHRSLFVAGWRPCIGWICGLAFAYHYVLLPLLLFILPLFGVEVKLPEFDTAGMMTVLMGMLGLGGLRTLEKWKGLTK